MLEIECRDCAKGNVIKGPAYASLDKSAWLCSMHNDRERKKQRV